MTSPFFSHKKEFFKKSFDHPNQTISDVRDLSEVDLGLLIKDRGSIEHEFNELYAALDINGENRRQFWLFCAQLCYMLELYSPEKAQHYADLSTLIANRINNNPPTVTQLSFADKVNRDINSLKTLPFSSARLRDLAAKATMQRISTRFTLLTLKELLLLARQSQFLVMFETLLGRPVNIDILDSPLGIYNALSVGIFVARLAINISMLMKHVFYPVGYENSLTRTERLIVEVNKRLYHLVNDVVWITVNLLTNYSAYFHVAAPVAGALMVGFLTFDAVWLGVTLYLIEQDYLKKLAEYQAYKSTLTEGSASYLMVNDQIEQLERSTEKARKTFWFYIAAASILVASLSVAFFLAPVALVPVCYLVANIAVAMYLSGDLFGVYQQKQLILEQLSANLLKAVSANLDVNDAQIKVNSAMQDVNDARNALILTMFKNTIAPFVIISAFTISVPAAVVLTLAYIVSHSECDYFSTAPATDALKKVGLWTGAGNNVATAENEDGQKRLLPK